MKLVGFIMLVMGCLLCNSCQGQRPGDDELSASSQHLTAGDTTGLRRQLDAVLSRQPHNERALNLRCKLFYQQRHYAAALQDAQQVLQLDSTRFTPDDFNALGSAGTICNNMGQFARARHYFRELQAIDSTSTLAAEGLALGYLEEWQYQAALAGYQHLVRLRPTAKAYYGVGITYFKLDDYQAALRAYDQAIQLNPASAAAYENRAGIRYLLHDLPGCCADLQRCEALGLAPAKQFRQQVCR